MNTEVHIAKTLDDLEEIALVFLRKHTTPGIFILEGTMGAGKTTFVSAVCRLLGAHSMGSPTFSIVNEYLCADGKKIFHFDLYRLKDLEEAFDFGIEEYLAGENNAWVFIEWPQIILPMLDEYKTISIADEKGERRISF